MLGFDVISDFRLQKIYICFTENYNNNIVKIQLGGCHTDSFYQMYQYILISIESFSNDKNKQQAT